MLLVNKILDITDKYNEVSKDLACSVVLLYISVCTKKIHTFKRIEALCIPSLKSLRKPTAILSQDVPILLSVFPIPESPKESTTQNCIRITSVQSVVLHKFNT
eukprot:609884-Ditylum_brightwellii.AAC.1